MTSELILTHSTSCVSKVGRKLLNLLVSRMSPASLLTAVSVSELSKKLGKSERTIQRTLKELNDYHLINKVNTSTGRGHISVYKIIQIKGDKKDSIKGDINHSHNMLDFPIVKGDIKGDKKNDVKGDKIIVNPWVERFNDFSSNYSNSNSNSNPTSKLQSSQKKIYKRKVSNKYRLNPKQVSLILSEFKDLNLDIMVEEFISYWSTKKKPKTWAPYLRLRTWLRNARSYRQNISNNTRRIKDITGNKFDNPDSGLIELARRSQNVG